jgi:hypothetical protein
MNSFTTEQCLSWQRAQYSHDKRNHFDILSLHKNDRLKHYGLHFAKYAGRFARGTNEQKTPATTAIDSLLVSLSAANTLHQKLSSPSTSVTSSNSLFPDYVSAAGEFCDACEKIDHMEPYVDQARSSIQAVFELSLAYCLQEKVNVDLELENRREFLRERQFYIED